MEGVLNNKVDELSSEKDRLKNERNAADAELRSVQNSFSFKFGRAVTFIPRKIRDSFKNKK